MSLLVPTIEPDETEIAECRQFARERKNPWWTAADDLALAALLAQIDRQTEFSSDRSTRPLRPPASPTPESSSRPDATVTDIPAPLVTVDSGTITERPANPSSRRPRSGASEDVSAGERIHDFVTEALPLDEAMITHLRQPMRSGLPPARATERKCFGAPGDGVPTDDADAMETPGDARHARTTVPEQAFWDQWLVGRLGTMNLCDDATDDSAAPTVVLVMLALLVAVLSLASLLV